MTLRSIWWTLAAILWVVVVFGGFVLACGQARYVVRCSDSLRVRSLHVELAQVGVVEATGNNDGVQVEAYLRSCGLSKGNPWCVALPIWSFDQVRGCDALPVRRVALATAVLADAQHRGVQSSGYRASDIGVYKHSHSASGHMIRVVRLLHDGWVLTVEGNTSSGASGSQRDGGGCYLRRRNMRLPLGRMAIAGFIGLGA